MPKYRVRFEIDEEVEAEHSWEAVEMAISQVCFGGFFEHELTEIIKKTADVEEIEEDEEDEEW